MVGVGQLIWQVGKDLQQSAAAGLRTIKGPKFMCLVFVANATSTLAKCCEQTQL
jgi:hypothetical protein